MIEKLLVPRNDLTRDGDLADWHAFSLAYYEPILRALRIMRVPEEDVDDLAHSFLIKVAEKDFLNKFLVQRTRQREAGKPMLFRSYLYRSLQNHVHDDHRRRVTRSREESGRLIEFDPAEMNPTPVLDPDAVYALDVLHQAIQALRRHAERSGKPHLWIFFEEMLLANEFRGRQGKTRAELMLEYPDKDANYVDNSLTTAKRAFRRFVQEVIPRGLREDVTPDERFEEWLEILRHSSASQFDLLHLAYRVTPFLSPDQSEARSTDLVVKGGLSDLKRPHELEPIAEPGVDEIGILVGFYLEMPLTDLLDAAELSQYLPPSNPFWRIPRKPKDSDSTRADLPTVRPISLLTLVAPDPEEERALASVDLLGLLSRIKSLAKQLHHQPNHSVPDSIARLFYTIVNVLAIIRCESNLHSIGDGSLARNIRWFLAQDWLDDRIKPLLQAGLTRLKGRK